MTVPSGRAGSGARSVLRAVFCGVFAIVGLVAGGCGSGTFFYGTVIVTVSADPGPFTAYIADIESLSLIQSNGNSGYGFSNSSGFGKTVDFTRLSDTTEVFGAPAVLEGTYTSITLTVNYAAGANAIASQIYVDVGGQSQAATLVDSTGATPGTVTYSVKFDPAHPLVVSRATPTTFDLHFDMSAATVVDPTVSPVKVTVRPYLTASTQPVVNKTLRTRGEFVAADPAGSNFTVNSVAFFDSPSYSNAPQGAIELKTTDQTTYNVNGTLYRGSAGLTALNTLAINTMIVAYGSYGDITQQKPVINATEVYAGVATEDVLGTRLLGTVASRTGNTLHIRNADLVAARNISFPAYGISTNSGVFVKFFNDVAVTVSDKTLVSIDRQPEVAGSAQLISVGQQVEIDGALSVNTAGTSSVDASAGLLRLSPTTAWGTLNSATANVATVTPLSIGGVKPAALTFTGTDAAGTDPDPAVYEINTGTVDLTAAVNAASPPLFRFDGIVTPFGTAPPDFTATAVTQVTPTAPNDQVLAIDWASTGTTAPFLSAGSSGLVVNIDNTSLGTSHVIMIGPTSIDLKNPVVSPTIVADASLTGQFSIGNPSSTTGISVFHTFAAYLTQLNTVLNGTNTVQKLVAVGHWDNTGKTFTAYRIDIVQLP
ncbi:MAG TPA: hypothetical protein VGO18_22075 [Steroidobacteraceae bacterium]|nr:hypothetical protein [Steroidobacteraceae bacterium]